MSDLRKQIEHTLNCHSVENGSNTPDYILAEYLLDCLAAFDKAVDLREQFHGRRIYKKDTPISPRGWE